MDSGFSARGMLKKVVRILVSVAVAFAISTVSLAAAAYADGAPGNTGKQGASCTGCHTGNAAKPTVTITGPATLAAGATGDFQMVVTTNLGRAAGGVAATDGVTLAPGTGFQEGNGELSHAAALTTAGGKATFSFKVTAPATGTTLKLFAVGMGSNGNGTGGDGTTQITKDIAVTGGGTAPTTPAPTTPTTPAGEDDDAADTAPASTSTSTSATEPAPAKKKKKTTTTDTEEEDEDDDRTIDPYAGRGGCSTSRAPLDASSAAAFVLVGLALVRRRRPSR